MMHIVQVSMIPLKGALWNEFELRGLKRPDRCSTTEH